MKLNNNMKAFVYTRVSTPKQGQYLAGHTSLETQRRECEEWLKEKYPEAEVVCYKDTHSARDTSKLPNLNVMLRKVKKGDMVLFYNVSRFARNLGQALNILCKLDQKGVKWVFVNDGLESDKLTAAKRHQLNIGLSNSQFESDQLSERVRKAFEYKRKIGSELGRAPFGYKAEFDNGVRKFVKDEMEQQILRYIKKEVTSYATFDMDNMSKALSDLSDDEEEKNNKEKNKEKKKKKKKTVAYDNIASKMNKKKWTYRGKLFTENIVKSLALK